MSERLSLQVETGSLVIDLTNEHGRKIGEFEFNPSDSGILKRYEAVVDFFNNASIGDDVDEDKVNDEIIKLEDGIRQQFDFLLGHNVSDGIFSECGALAICANGDFFFETVLDGIGNIVEKVTEQRVSKKLSKVKKATAKYRK